MKAYLKLMLVSLCFIVVVAGFSIIYGFIAHGLFTMRYAFNTNFFVAAVFIVVGTVLMFMPNVLTLKGSMLIDRLTMIERSYDSREDRQKKARMVLWFGIFNMVFTGLIQLFLSVVIV